MVVTLAATEMVLAVKLSEEVVVMPPATSKSLVDVLSDTAPDALMPFELTVYDQVPADPHYTRFRDEFEGASAAIYTTH